MILWDSLQLLSFLSWFNFKKTFWKHALAESCLIVWARCGLFGIFGILLSSGLFFRFEDSLRFFSILFFFFWWIEWNCFRWLWILSSFQGFFVMLGDSWGFPFSFLFQRTLCWDYLGFCLDCYELFDTCKHSSRFFWNQREFFRDSSEMLLLFVSLSDLESFGICSSFDDLS